MKSQAVEVFELLIETYATLEDHQKTKYEAQIKEHIKKLTSDELFSYYKTRSGESNPQLQALNADLQIAMLQHSPKLFAQEIVALINNMPKTQEILKQVLESMTFTDEFINELVVYDPVRSLVKPLLEMDDQQRNHDPRMTIANLFYSKVEGGQYTKKPQHLKSPNDTLAALRQQNLSGNAAKAVKQQPNPPVENSLLSRWNKMSTNETVALAATAAALVATGAYLYKKNK